MKKLILIFALQVVASIVVFAGEDTISSRIDTVICTVKGDAYSYTAPYDTSLFDFQWVDFGGEVVDSQSVFIFEASDSIILYAFPLDSMGSCYIDSVFINLSFLPKPTIEIPAAVCFDGNAVQLIENSIYDSLYTTVTYELSSGAPIESTGNTLLFDIDNGDTILFSAHYFHDGCNIDTVFTDTIYSLFTPQLAFETTSVCFGDSSSIFNNSDYDADIAEVVYSIPFLGDTISNNEEIHIELPANGQLYDISVMISQGTCISETNFSIETLLQPTAEFSAPNVCENELLQISNSSIDTESANFTFSNNSQNLAFNSTSFILSDTLSDGLYTLEGILINGNGCADTTTFDVIINEVTYVNFTGLESAYCENQDASTLQANVTSGILSFSCEVADYLVDNGNGTAVFAPSMADRDVAVIFSFTNSFGCTDTYTESVDTIYPKPVLELSGLLPAYCELGDASLLLLNQNISDSSIFSIDSNGVFFDAVTDLEYTFDPVIPGSYIIENMYTDANGCFNTIVNTTVVNPLPEVEVDSLMIINVGDEIEIGNLGADELNVIYEWSNGDQFSSTFVSQPGIYFITATNMVTECAVMDSLILQYDENYNAVDLESISIFPNPTVAMVSIKLSSPSQNISIVNTSGEAISIGGASAFSTDLSGLLELNLTNINQGYYYINVQDIGVFLLIKL